MRKTIYTRYDKEAIGNLPVVSFEGRIIVVLTEAEAEKAVDYLLSCDILGMDTETRPAFKRGQSFQVSLLQVSTRDTCFLFRLNMIGLCPAVIRLLENTKVPMIGLSWHDDLRMLHKRGDFTPGLFYDIQEMVGEIGIKDLSLQKLYANLFSQKISKRQRLTNWEAPVLNDLQKRYASLDAWACIMLYEEIKRLKETQDYDLIIMPEPEQQQPLSEEERAARKAEKEARKAEARRAKREEERAEKAKNAPKKTAAKPSARKVAKTAKPVARKRKTTPKKIKTEEKINNGIQESLS